MIACMMCVGRGKSVCILVESGAVLGGAHPWEQTVVPGKA